MDDGGEYGRFKRSRNTLSASTGGEMKFFDTTMSFLFDSTAEIPSVGGQITLIPQGSGGSDRLGRKVTIRSIEIRAIPDMQPVTNLLASTAVDMYIVQDTQCNGAAASVFDIFKFTTGSRLPTAMINLNNVNRFRIIKKFTWTFTATSLGDVAGFSGGTFNNETKRIDWIAHVNIPIDFTATAAADPTPTTIDMIKSNNLFIVAGSFPEADTVQCLGQTRIRYTDP